ncbi:hypothetical protein ACHAWF_009190 [Thalassiosira exigua]
MLHLAIYVCGLCVLLFKTKSRFTPPKSFGVYDYKISTISDADNNGYISRIPKIIHQSYKSLDTLPEKWADTPSRWKELHPTFEYKFWSDDDNRNLIKQHYPWFLETYDGYPAPIQRADAARYFAVLLHHGGIYADMDVLPIRRFDLPENEDKEMIVAETYNLGLTNALFASVPNSTVLSQFVRDLPSHTHPFHGLGFIVPHFVVMISTGPTRLWIFLNKYDRSKILTINPASWGQCHQCKQKHCVPAKGSFFETREGGSWHKFIFCHPHFSIWGVACLVFMLSSRCMASGACCDMDGIKLVGNVDVEQGIKDVTGKKRKWKPTNSFSSWEKDGFVLRALLSEPLCPIFCGLILLLVL